MRIPLRVQVTQDMWQVYHYHTSSLVEVVSHFRVGCCYALVCSQDSVVLWGASLRSVGCRKSALHLQKPKAIKAEGATAVPSLTHSLSQFMSLHDATVMSPM